MASPFDLPSIHLDPTECEAHRLGLYGVVSMLTGECSGIQPSFTRAYTRRYRTSRGDQVCVLGAGSADVREGRPTRDQENL
jgi:hypothetical protein